MPARLTRPIVGFSPTRPFWLAGLMIEPVVSVPIAAAAKLIAVAAAEPELEPPMNNSPGPYGLSVRPPLELIVIFDPTCTLPIRSYLFYQAIPHPLHASGQLRNDSLRQWNLLKLWSLRLYAWRHAYLYYPLTK